MCRPGPHSAQASVLSTPEPLPYAGVSGPSLPTALSGLRLRTPDLDRVVQRARHQPVVEDVQGPHARALQRPAAGPVGAPHADGVVAARGNLQGREGGFTVRGGATGRNRGCPRRKLVSSPQARAHS